MTGRPFFRRNLILLICFWEGGDGGFGMIGMVLVRGPVLAAPFIATGALWQFPEFLGSTVGFIDIPL